MPTRTRPPLAPLLDATIWLAAAQFGRQPRHGPLHGGVGAGRMQHSEWSALLLRFVQDGRVDYGTMTRVRRLIGVYLSRLAEADPEAFVDADDQVAFYLNAYNVIAVDQIVRHYPVASIRDIPDAFVRPYPIGRRNLSLQVIHASMLRSFGDPRVHAAICTTALGSAPLRPEAFTGSDLQHQLDAALRDVLADPTRGAFYDPASNTLHLSALFRWMGGDFVAPAAMPSLRPLIGGWGRPAALLAALRPYLPVEIVVAIEAHPPTLRFLPYDWSLNLRQPVASGATIHAV